MLSDARALDAVLARGSPAFEAMVRSRTLVNMGTVAPEYSAALALEVQRNGGVFVEAPVSGSRTPAEAGELVAMLAGDPAVIELVQPFLEAMCSRQVLCGTVPQALLTKLAVNHFLITMVTGLAEAFHFARQVGADLNVLADVLNAGPMASSVSRVKAAMLRDGDFTLQASISDVLYNTRLIAQAARDSDADASLLAVCERLYAQAEAAGHGGDDMAAVVNAIRDHG